MSESMIGKWCGSGDGELFDGPASDSPEEAWSNWMAENGDGHHVCRAVGQMTELLNFKGHAEDVLGNMECRASERAHPDLCVDLIGVNKANTAELDALIAKVLELWCKLHGVRFGSCGVENIRKCDENGVI